MTVSELIEQLKNYPSDMRVLTLGYEGGFNDIDLRTDEIVFDVNNKDTWYYGPHESVSFMDAGQCRKPGSQSGKCVIIGRSK